ncbi:MAG: response regulator transcription factor [Bryobacteraceae bacterium]
MIRVAIITNTLLRAQSVATVLGEDERLEIIEVHASHDKADYNRSGIVDVVVTAGLLLDQIPLNGPPVVALTNERVEEMPLGHSIRAWLPINAPPSELGAAIVAAANELVVLTQGQVSEWLGGPRSAHANGFEIEALTPRELQVLRMLADGLGNKEIAGQLNISDHTAKFHVAQILAKLRASSRTEAVSIGIRRGLVPI